MEYKNYVFDLYGTLVDIKTDEEDMNAWSKLSLFYGYYDALYDPEELKERYFSLVNQEEDVLGSKLADVHEAHPEIKLENVFKKLYEEKGANPSDELVMHTGQFFRVLTTEYIKLYDGVIELLSRLKKAGKKVYLLSNAQRIFTEYELHVLNIAQYFDDIFISSDYGIKKPDKRFFNMLIEKHSIKTSESIMIGNDMRSDIEGAQTVGMNTMYIHSNISPELVGKPEADFVLAEMDMERVMDLLEV